ncbi:MAG: hypothetical protein WCA46_13930 [Actinocatenispora sp.]
MIRLSRMAALALAAGTAGLALGAPAHAAPSGHATAAHHATHALTASYGVAASSDAGTRLRDDPPIYECSVEGSWSWPAGNPVPVTYTSGWTCADPLTIGQGLVTTSLRSAADNSTVSTAPTASEVLVTEINSGTDSGPINRPTSLYLHQEATIQLAPESDGTPDIWYTLPDECTGVGTPTAFCSFDWTPFTM